MAALNKPRSLLQCIIDGAAERIATQFCILPENHEAMRDAAVHIIEQQISAVLGADSIVISGWLMPPSQRLARRERIVAALRAGERAQAIADRELVSARWVWRLQAELVAAEQSPPEQFSRNAQQ